MTTETPAGWQRKIKAANADWKWVQIDPSEAERAEWVRFGYEIRPFYTAPFASAEPAVAVAWRYRRKYQDGTGWTDWALSETDPRWQWPGAEFEPLYASPAPPPVAISEEMRLLIQQAFVQAQGALRLDAMRDEHGEPYGTTTVALEAISAAEDALAAALSAAPAGEVGWRTRFVTWLEGEIAELEGLIDKGQGEHGKPGYVREATWHAWYGQLSALHSARHQLPALPPSPTGGDKP